MPGPFDSFSGAVGQASSTLGSIGTQAMGTLGTIAGTAGRISGAINSAQGAVASVSALRSISLPPGGNPVAKFAAGAALFNGAIGQAAGALGAIASIFGGGSGDWRARLTILRQFKFRAVLPMMSNQLPIRITVFSLIKIVKLKVYQFQHHSMLKTQCKQMFGSKQLIF